MEKSGTVSLNTDSKWSKQEACFCTCDSGVARCQSQHVPVSLLANAFNVRSVLHRQVSLAAVNQICVIHEAIDLKIH